jgi:SAM-dependent methyltransferase
VADEVVDGGQLHRNRERASSFGDNAELYDATRPRYPTALIDELSARTPERVLDVGCGTGILGGALVDRGLSVLGVEPDARMAELARHRGLTVEPGTFEAWEPAARTFDLLVAGQAWHWVDPVEGAQKAARIVALGGRVALAWNHASLPDDLRAELDEVYLELGGGKARPTVIHKPEEWRRDGGSETSFVATGAFSAPDLRSYPWDRTYTTAEWLAQLETHSDHHVLDAGPRQVLLDAVGRTLDARGGTFEMHYDCHVTFFDRR